MTRTIVDYYFTPQSPWTYLGHARFAAMARRADAEVRVRPVDFGAVFPVSGGLPLGKRAPQRQAYRLQELARWREATGVPITVQPKHFPSKEVPGACAVVAVRETQGDAPAIRLAHRILKALWEEEQDPGDPATLARLVAEAGLDAEAVLALGAEPRWAAMRDLD